VAGGADARQVRRGIAAQVLQHAHRVGRAGAGRAARPESDADITRLDGQHLLGRAHQPLLGGDVARGEELQAQGGGGSHQGISRESRPEMMLYKMAPATAHQNPLTWKPRRMDPASQNNKAVSTMRNRPRVTMVMGSVNNTSTGLTSMFNRPSPSAATSAEPKLATVMPGSR